MGLHERWLTCYPEDKEETQMLFKGVRDRMTFNGAFDSEILMILYLSSQISCDYFKMPHSN